MDNLQPLIIESAQLLLIGMGTVFIILIMLIFLINLTSKMLSGFSDEPDNLHALGGHATSQYPVQSNDELIAVISTAVSTYKKRSSAN
jgi:oxaloacetate decarboxylase gamma subunit